MICSICDMCNGGREDGVYVCCSVSLKDRNDHTTMTAPLPVCSAKLSIVWPG